MTIKKLLAFILVLACFAGNSASAENSFDGITCKSDIASMLIGRRMPNYRVITIEERYKAIGTKDLGAFGMEPDGDPMRLPTLR